VVKGGGSGADRGPGGWVLPVSGNACERPAAGYGVAAVWSGWGGAGNVGARRQVEVGEEGAHEVTPPSP
jgi:hypothetical protein